MKTQFWNATHNMTQCGGGRGGFIFYLWVKSEGKEGSMEGGGGYKHEESISIL